MTPGDAGVSARRVHLIVPLIILANAVIHVHVILDLKEALLWLSLPVSWVPPSGQSPQPSRDHGLVVCRGTLIGFIRLTLSNAFSRRLLIRRILDVLALGC